MTMKRNFVLENQNGEVSRRFVVYSKEAVLVYRHDKRRLEMYEDTKNLQDQNIHFDVIANLQDDKAQNLKIKTGSGIVTTLRLAQSEDTFEKNIALPQDDEEELKRSFVWTSYFTLGVFVFLLASIFFLADKTLVPVQEVVVIPQDETKPLEKHKQRIVVAANKHQTQKTNKRVTQTHQKVTHAQSIRRQNTNRSHSMASTQESILEALGNQQNSQTRGGIKIDASQTTRGAGLGGTGGSGGMQQAFNGKGLSSAPLGPGNRANGGGGYGNHGHGGGAGGFGKTSLIGSSGAYFEPLSAEADVDGGLDESEIYQVIERHQGQIRNCYERGLQSTPQLSGRVALKFIIGGSGTVNTANVANSSLRSQTVESCILEKLKSWKFPNPRGGVMVKVNYPFNFKRAGSI